jgi:DNA-binding CsgD family transcriptional regulator
MLDDQKPEPRTFDDPNDYASMHGEKFCGEVPEGSTTYPHHCLHGASANDHACCWCGDVFVPDTCATKHGRNFHNLTRQQVAALTLMAEGLSNKLIGERLDISMHTAKWHVDHAIKKLGTVNRAGAVAVAIRRGIIP